MQSFLRRFRMGSYSFFVNEEQTSDPSSHNDQEVCDMAFQGKDFSEFW